MTPTDFYERYFRRHRTQIFRGEDLPAGIPQSPGLYAWYYRPRLTRRAREDACAAGPSGIADYLRLQAVEPFQRQPYRVTVSAALEPAYEGLAHNLLPTPRIDLPDGEDPAALLAECETFYSDSFAPLFAAPLYVGKAVRQTLSRRVAQHLALVDKYRTYSRETLAQHRRQLLSELADSDLPDELDEERAREYHSLALELAARAIPSNRLLLVTYAAERTRASSAAVTCLEWLVNRSSFPVLGRK